MNTTAFVASVRRRRTSTGDGKSCVLLFSLPSTHAHVRTAHGERATAHAKIDRSAYRRGTEVTAEAEITQAADNTR